MANGDTEQFVELNRRFRKLEQKSKPEDAAVESYTLDLLLGRTDSFNWSELLKENRVVILGEPGSGKSWEFRERAKILAANGEAAFFIRLDQLVDADLEELFDVGTKDRFLKWRRGRQMALFFLDSVDEAKFQRIADFHAALGKFQKSIGEGITRSKIFLSSRISEWQPLSDEFLFRQLLPVSPEETRVSDTKSKTEKSKAFPLVVCIEPLDREQVEKYAVARGMSDVATFIKALDAAFAWEFARRPLDVADLVEFWLEHKRIGSLTELIEFDITAKLRSRHGRDDFRLSDGKKLEGVKWLAAASVLSRKFSFFVPDDNPPGADALRPLSCLPVDWSEDEMRALLNRAIFDSAVYGRLRFHHRRIGEYLAAKWLSERMAGGCHPLELERILSASVRGRKMLRPALRSVAAWLCYGDEHWNNDVRRLVLDTDPTIHLNYGDPARLSMTYRRQVLDALAELSKNRKRVWFDSSPESLARIASPSIAPSISKHALNRDLADDFRVELFGIVQHGRLADCIDAAFSVVNTQDESFEVKLAAVRAIGAMENTEILKRLHQTVRSLGSIPNAVCIGAVQALYPKTISSLDLIELLRKIGHVKEFSVDFPYFLVAHLQKELKPSEAGTLLKLLLELARTPPLHSTAHKTLEISDHFWWIGKVIPTVLEILLEQKQLTEEETDTAAKALSFLSQFQEGWHFSRQDIGDLNDKTIRHPNLRQNYFWRSAADCRSEQKTEPTAGVQIFGHYEVLKLHSSDFEWLIGAAISRQENRDKELALRIAIEVWDSSGRRTWDLFRLWSLSKKNTVLAKMFRESPYASAFFPLKRFWWRHIRFKFGKWWWIHRFDSVKHRWRWLRGQLILWRNLGKLRSGERVDWLHTLCREGGEGGSSWVSTSWDKLKKNRGKIIATATKQGCIAYWKTYTPPLPHEKAERNTTSIGTVVGLTGLQIEFSEKPTAVVSLTGDQAALATRYAVNELNEFPNWFENLAHIQREAVGTIICACIDAEWNYPAEQADTHEVLHKIGWHGASVFPLVQDKLMSLLDVGDPKNYSILRLTLAALSGGSSPPVQQIAKLAPQRIAMARTIRDKALWFAVWMEIDGEASIAALEMALDGLPDAVELVVCICSLLSGEGMQRPAAVKNPSYLRPLSLRKFIPLVYRYVKYSEDIDRTDGGAYTPTARDHAERFRSTILDYLAKVDAPETSDLLRQLADEPTMHIVRDWILNLLQQRLEKEADLAPWSSDDLRAFSAKHEFEPKNDKELFSIAGKRLQILKWDVEKAENSLREEGQAFTDEYQLRRWFQRKLRERSLNHYTIPQEAEIDQEQRPDLRFEHPRTDAVSVEIKWAENWTLKTLLERLENQLVGQYLRAHNSHFGIFLLGLKSDKVWKEPETGNSLTFEQIIEIVKRRALELMQSNANVFGLEVIAIDFRDPPKTKQS